MTYPCIDAIELDWNSCFARSRRLTGMNRYFDGPAAILETRGPLARDAAALQRWAQVAGALSRALWNDEAALCQHLHAHGAELLIRCPQDQLFTATEVNEFAWEVAALGDDDRPVVDGFDRSH
ncbi:MAG TPA: hypothetical protein VFV17_09725, partial [Usitatibacteraceae bacterium]|nr:hypothetical protein [Usitatibacteraceae bacterium]